MKKRFLALLLSLVMVLSLMPSVAVFAEDGINNTTQCEMQSNAYEETQETFETDVSNQEEALTESEAQQKENQESDSDERQTESQTI